MQENIKRNPYYIYNLLQCNWLLQQGCLPEEAGKGMKGDLYLKFPRTPEIEEKMSIFKQGKAIINKD
ncbi:hypothetical protein [Desulfocucumis palustris]|uniref:hypothetical protein n=1 Tax=Desulfocucumis palustris TaxID=1898651 RepID=UPI000CE9DA8E|nr:hypothetical protein [Desulfocucumis palustris]